MSSPHGCTVCLMVTFNGSTRLEDLPEVLRVYCIPLAPHGLLRRRPGAKHIHTFPEWPRENTWVIARKFDTYGNLAGRWENRASDDPAASSYTLDRENQAVLAQSEKERRIQWELSCAEDGTLRKRCYDEYKDLRRELHTKRQAENSRCAVQTSGSSSGTSVQHSLQNEVGEIAIHRSGNDISSAAPRRVTHEAMEPGPPNLNPASTSVVAEFRAWLVEERKINPEMISKEQTKKEFAQFL
ncbi:hypothetical protein PYCCODRAFT_1472343 [Trametes coccinea BRFM310]|uniref:Uncharacterized protein n=1 Tax=Trametes coccinea (strain BRFM310) TaxID=1353009 RepID=A0A1Y2I6L8_TRAC3|nr:hypothetical protein PYCCODRAFT_1472343 [Trametes coccinea BRFM310]